MEQKSNFKVFMEDERFAAFSEIAVAAEMILTIDEAACVLNCRRAMETAVKWMYSVDSDLEMPYQDSLVSLMSTEGFRDIIGHDMWCRLDFIRRSGNIAAHTARKITRDQALLCLENLYRFFDFIAYCYSSNYSEGEFSAEKIPEVYTSIPEPEPDVRLETLMAENASLRDTLTELREAKAASYQPKGRKITEYETRKLYIDTMLEDAGWTEGLDWVNEAELPGMPNRSKVGYADYVLYGDDGRPLAVIEAKRTCVDVSKGRQQAKLYADLLEQKYARRPVIFLSNGFETRIDDGQYPERNVAGIYSKRDLERLFNLRAARQHMGSVTVRDDIAGRYYQKAAIQATCDRLEKENRRKALLVMATGSGKTRTVIGLCEVLLRHGWVKNILFLADRTSLVIQAKRAFVNMLPDLSISNLCEGREDAGANCIFSTYPTMMNCIDSTADEKGKLFTPGHFDLVVCDEAHRSIYNKYKDIFDYFDAPLVGLTATPKDDIDKNTYEVFELENGVPTYGYELAQAVTDGYLVDFQSVETKIKFLEQGIHYDELSPEEKQEYEACFTKEDGELPESMDSAALNEWIFNEDTISKVLHTLMENGLRISYGEKLGKSIIFAKNHRHAEKIFEIFGREFPNLPGYARVIDNHMQYAQSAIDEFSEPDRLPQIAISVDMLDTGIDVPEVLNLVMFKKVRSKAKFWQMIGRGTRLCPGLLDGEDKKKFLVFDFCGNFDFFRMGKKTEAQAMISLQSALFALRFEICYKLQELEYQLPALQALRGEHVKRMLEKVHELNRDQFNVRMHLDVVDTYSAEENYSRLTYEDTLIVRKDLAPLMEPDQDEAKALRFDALMYGMELAYLSKKPQNRMKSDLTKKVSMIAKYCGNIPEVQQQVGLIDEILHSDLTDRADVPEMERIRTGIRGLMKYIPHTRLRFDTHFEDEILSMEVRESELDSDDLKNYKQKAEYYVRKHRDNIVIGKLHTNQQLTPLDLESLKKILWSEVGTQKEYEETYGNEPLGEFVRRIVGLDMNAAKEAFADFLNDASLDTRQIYFVNQIVEYVVRNGLMKDYRVLTESPFTDKGNVSDLFGSRLDLWQRIRGRIQQINDNAAV